MIDKKLMGKKSRAAGNRFELKVREDLEKKGGIVDKWSNNVEFHNDEDVHGLPFVVGKLVKAKPKFVFNPQLKRRIPMGMSSGFPDFIAYKHNRNIFVLETDDLRVINEFKAKWEASPKKIDLVTGGGVKIFPEWEVMGVEAKMDGKLDKKEKEISKWLLDNNIFSKILIAKKGIKRGQIVYDEFK